MDADWQNYFIFTDGAMSGSVMVDAALAETAETLLPASTMVLRFDLGETHESGLPTAEEGTRLLSFDEAMQDLVRRSGAQYLGRLTMAGRRICYLLVPDHADLEGLRADLTDLGAGRGYALAFRREAEALKSYREVLLPDAAERRQIRDLEVLERLSAEGDLPDEEHEIDFYCHFPSMAVAEDFIRWAEDTGFTLSGSREDGVGPLPVEVALVVIGTTGLYEVWNRSVVLQRACEAHGGDYEGWGCFAVKTRAEEDEEGDGEEE